jgi:hypothetical protein
MCCFWNLLLVCLSCPWWLVHLLFLANFLDTLIWRYVWIKLFVISFKIFFYFWQYWHLNSGFQVCYAGTLLLEARFPALFSLVILEIGPHFLPRLTGQWSFDFKLPIIAGMASRCHHTQPFFPLRYGLTNFYFSLNGMKVWSQPPMTGAHYWTQPFSTEMWSYEILYRLY